MPAAPGRRFPGLVRRVGVAADLEDGVPTYPVVIELDNPDGLLRPGMSAAVRFDVATAEGVLVVPEAALRFQPAGAPPAAAPRTRVFKLQGERELAEVAVVRGLNEAGRVEVRPERAGALREGDAVVYGVGAADPGDRTDGAPGLSLGGR